ncbi:MAG: hypothetical protein CM15mP53_01940 [Ectothiorhodospiraceae bacterium]|nr:MAG: hypothetical protein CM15mP53_01940 [Ectothiorhodospiraceae bacterium]
MRSGNKICDNFYDFNLASLGGLFFSFLTIPLGMIGIFPALANSLIVGTVILRYS